MARRDVDRLRNLQPQDLIKYGFIPEFIGRMPVVATLDDLDKTALVQILTRPKNAIIKQYQRLFDFENVKLKFSDEALEAVELHHPEGKLPERVVRARVGRVEGEDPIGDLVDPLAVARHAPLDAAIGTALAYARLPQDLALLRGIKRVHDS